MHSTHNWPLGCNLMLSYYPTYFSRNIHFRTWTGLRLDISSPSVQSNAHKYGAYMANAGVRAYNGGLGAVA